MVQPSTNGEGTRTRPECANYTMAQEQTSFLNKTYDTHEDKLPDVSKNNSNACYFFTNKHIFDRY